VSVGPKGPIFNRDCAFPFLGAAGGRKKCAPVLKPDEGEEVGTEEMDEHIPPGSFGLHKLCVLCRLHSCLASV
jgi:hypothetical protein